MELRCRDTFVSLTPSTSTFVLDIDTVFTPASSDLIFDDILRVYRLATCMVWHDTVALQVLVRSQCKEVFDHDSAIQRATMHVQNNTTSLFPCGHYFETDFCEQTIISLLAKASAVAKDYEWLPLIVSVQHILGSAHNRQLSQSQLLSILTISSSTSSLVCASTDGGLISAISIT